MPLVSDLSGLKVQEAFQKVSVLGLELKLCRTTSDPPDTWIAATEDYKNRTVHKHNDATPEGSDVPIPGPVGVTIVGGIEPLRTSTRTGQGADSSSIGPHSQVVQIGGCPVCAGGFAGGVPSRQSWWLPLAIGFGIGLVLGMVLVLAFGNAP